MSKTIAEATGKPEPQKKKAEDTEETKVKECFIITPLGANGSDIRRKADGLINVVLQPILEELGFSVIPPHKMLTAGSITIQIIEKLLNADLVVCNLTGLNPNVMYELAVRHASRKPIVCLYESGSNPLPFDIATERTIFYSDDIAGVEAVKPTFREYAIAAMNDAKPDNPIYRVAQTDLIKLEKGSVNAESVIIDRLNELSSQVSRLSTQPSPTYSNSISSSLNSKKTFAIQVITQGNLSANDVMTMAMAQAVPYGLSLVVEATSSPDLFVIKGNYTDYNILTSFHKRLLSNNGWTSTFFSHTS